MEKKLILSILPGVQSMFIEYAKCVLLDIWIKYCTFKLDIYLYDLHQEG